MMERILLFFLLCNTINLGLTNIQPSETISVTSGEGFVAYLSTPEGFGEPVLCYAVPLNDEPIEINLKQSETITTSRKETITRYSSKVCGIRVDNVSALSGGYWLLLAESDNMKINGRLKVNILNQANNDVVEVEEEHEIGKEVAACKSEKSALSCRVVDPDKNVFDSLYCDKKILVREDSTWECNTLYPGRITESKRIVNVKVLKPYTTSTMVESEDYLSMTCDFSSVKDRCKAELPDKITLLSLGEGLNNERYSTGDTNVKNNRCTLQIKKPLQPSDQGIWRIYDTNNLGCIFYVGDKQKLIEEELQNKPEIKEHDAKGSENVWVELKVPFNIDRCYVKSPSGETKFPEQNTFQYRKSIGLCRIYVGSEAGIFSGAVSGPDHKDMVHHQFKIFRHTYGEGTALTPNTQTSIGESVHLQLRNSYLNPLVQCVFEDPQGNLYFVADDPSNERFEYYGEPLEKGYCGITIKNIRQSDFGEWKCYYTSTSRANEYTERFYIRETLGLP